MFIGSNNLPFVLFDGYDKNAAGAKVDEGLFEVGITSNRTSSANSP